MRHPETYECDVNGCGLIKQPGDLTWLTVDFTEANQSSTGTGVAINAWPTDDDLKANPTLLFNVKHAHNQDHAVIIMQGLLGNIGK